MESTECKLIGKVNVEGGVGDEPSLIAVRNFLLLTDKVGEITVWNITSTSDLLSG